MILGMAIFTFVHVLLSLTGIFAGVVVLFGLLTSKGAQGLDGRLYLEHAGNQRDWVLISVPPLSAVWELRDQPAK
jgi:hypothetical protein